MKKTILLSFAFLLFGIANTKSQIIGTFAGTGTSGSTGDGGPATSAELHGPTSVAFDANWNIYISEAAKVREVNATTGVITTVAGNGVGGFSGDGGQANACELSEFWDLTFDGVGNMYLVSNERIRKIGTNGIIHTIAGNGVAGYSGDGGPASSAELNKPYGVLTDASGNIYIADNIGRRIRKINSSGTI